MIKSKGYAAHNSSSALTPFEFTRRELQPDDVLISILYCGICHSDLHQVRNEWHDSTYPMVPGHEIVGTVTRVGAKVTKFKEGQIVGVGCMVDACLRCFSCEENLEQYCENGFTPTYNGIDKITNGPIFGGYSNNIVVKDHFVLSIPENLHPANVAPLLCAGITTFSPLKFWGIDATKKVAVVGLGGLGHMAVKLAHAMGAEVTVLSRSLAKKEAALKLGASNVIASTDENKLTSVNNYFDLIINTVSAANDLNLYLSLLKREGVMVLLGIPEKSPELQISQLIRQRRSLAGSLIGSIAETQEMLEFCSKHNIAADIEIIAPDYINTAFERLLKSDVKYRFVIDMQKFS